jgi:hypothetical protein
MYPVAHAAIAVGAVKAGERLFPARWLPLDYRFAAFGALLPDLVDKPLKWFIVPSLPDDHLIAHTIWLPVVLVLSGAFIGRRRAGMRMLLLGVGALTHLMVDPVNAHPRTLFWPLLGTEFPDVGGYLFVLPICTELVLWMILAVTMRRSEVVRQRVRQFVRSGTL